MIQSRNKYLQFMLVMLAAWAIAWGALFWGRLRKRNLWSLPFLQHRF